MLYQEQDAGETETALGWAGVTADTVDQTLARLGMLREELRELTGTRKLMLAILEQALKDVLHPSRHIDPEDRASSRRWVMATYESSDFPDFQTFEGICSSLGMDADRLRAQVIALCDSSRRMRLSFREGGDTRRRERRPKRIRIAPIGERAA